MQPPLFTDSSFKLKVTIRLSSNCFPPRGNKVINNFKWRCNSPPTPIHTPHSPIIAFLCRYQFALIKSHFVFARSQHISQKARHWLPPVYLMLCNTALPSSKADFFFFFKHSTTTILITSCYKMQTTQSDKIFFKSLLICSASWVLIEAERHHSGRPGRCIRHNWL